ncbi:methyltransferase domain-containing protein [Patescibacteria group bacterium]
MLSNYHMRQAALPDQEIESRVGYKKEELDAAFAQLAPDSEGEPATVAVLGCADPRYVPLHRKMFEQLLGRPVDLTTYDIAVEHLEGAEGVVEHDCTEPLPGGPFDIAFAHVLLKFIETEGQWDVIENAHAALKPGGLAVFVFDEADFGEAGEKTDDGGWAVPLEQWKEQLGEASIEFAEVPVQYGLVLVVKRAVN